MIDYDEDEKPVYESYERVNKKRVTNNEDNHVTYDHDTRSTNSINSVA